MLSHCRPPPTVGHGEVFKFAGHWQTQRPSPDSDQPSITGGKKNGWQKFQSALCRGGARGARARFKDGVREHPRRRTHPGASTDNAGTRTRGRVGVRARGKEQDSKKQNARLTVEVRALQAKLASARAPQINRINRPDF